MFSKLSTRGAVGCLVALLVLLVGCGPGQPPEPGTVEVEEVSLSDTEREGPVLEGVFVNRKDEPIRVAQVRVTIYDADNQPLGDTFIEVRDIDANGRKTFREVVEVRGDVQRARVKGILVP